MKKRIFLNVLIILFNVFPAISQNSEKITIGNVERIYSKVLKEERKIWVYNPGYGQNKNNTDHYPVLYLLDAEDHFYSTVGMIKQMRGRWPEMIVVGITNTNRDRDLKPIITNPNGVVDLNSGGDGNFMNFIEKELIPHIDSLYSSAPYRIFSGHPWYQ